MNILLEYYHINIYTKQTYFEYKNNLYYFTHIKNLVEFEHIYQLYLYYMNLSHLNPYQIVYNKNNCVHTYEHILFIYRKQKINLSLYLQHFIKPIQQVIYIRDIKEQWIKKSDQLRKHIKHDPITPFIYYYTGLIEYSITLLNQILKIDVNAFVPLTLSLKHSVDNIQQILNPTYYIISSRMRHIALLLKSGIVDVEIIIPFIQQNQFSLIELYYLVACVLYPHDINYDLLQSYSYMNYNEYMYKVINIYNKLYKILNNYISICEISWLKI